MNRINVRLQLRIGSIAVRFVLVYISLNRSFCSIAVRFILINISLNGSISSIAVGFVLVYVCLNSSVTGVNISLSSEKATLRGNCAVNVEVSTHGGVAIYI